ncbi:MAG: hypothetical protein WC471_04270 [Candidatus Woesearchaeota archaeon]
MITVYCFGNEYISNDKLAKEIAGKLSVPDVEFVLCDGIEDIFEVQGTIYIMDVVKNLREVTILHGMEYFKVNPSVSCHDFDLGYFLKLFQKMGRIGDVVVIGLPMQ